jgi:outer membrane protein TolC
VCVQFAPNTSIFIRDPAHDFLGLYNYSYQKTLQTGFVEVVNGLKGLDNFRAAAALRQREVDVLTLGVSTTNDLYLAGYASYLEVITAQRSVLEAELNLAEARQAQLLQSVNLYRTLGGGWDAP